MKINIIIRIVNGLRKTGYDVDITVSVGVIVFTPNNFKTISLFIVILH